MQIAQMKPLLQILTLIGAYDIIKLSFQYPCDKGNVGCVKRKKKVDYLILSAQTREASHKGKRLGNIPYKVGFMVTCLVNSFRPPVGFASIKLLENAGCEVTVPPTQTCCGQPSYNSGDTAGTIGLAKKTIQEFEKFDYMVAPSGSCMGAVKAYPSLFEAGDQWKDRAEKLANKSYELTQFLCAILKYKPTAKFEESFTYHDACTGLRELKIKNQPRALLKEVGANLHEMEDGDVCCGFGGLFSIKYSDISDRIVNQKTDNIKDTDITHLLGGDLGCLINMAGKLKRGGSNIEVRHLAEVLSGLALEPPIMGEEKK